MSFMAGFACMTLSFVTATEKFRAAIFNLPDMIWFWWALEGLVLNGLAGMALGWSVGRFGSDQQR